jgi:hypothetical protein
MAHWQLDYRLMSVAPRAMLNTGSFLRASAVAGCWSFLTKTKYVGSDCNPCDGSAHRCLAKPFEDEALARRTETVRFTIPFADGPPPKYVKGVVSTLRMMRT